MYCELDKLVRWLSYEISNSYWLSLWHTPQDELEFGYIDSPHHQFPVVLDSPRDGKLKDFPYESILVSETEEKFTQNGHLLTSYPPPMLFQTNISIKFWSHTNLKMYRNTKTLCHRGQTLGTWHGMLWMRRRAVWTPSVTWRLVHQSQSTGKVTHLAGSSLEWRSLRKYHNSTETTNNNILKSLHTIYVIID